MCPFKQELIEKQAKWYNVREIFVSAKMFAKMYVFPKVLAKISARLFKWAG